MINFIALIIASFVSASVATMESPSFLQVFAAILAVLCGISVAIEQALKNVKLVEVEFNKKEN